MGQSITSIVELSETGAKMTSKKYTIGISSSIGTDTKKSGNVEKDISNTTSLSYSYRFESGLKARASLTLDKDLKNDREQSLRDPSLSLTSKLPRLGKYISTSAKAALKVPLSESSRKTTGLNTALSLSSTLVYDATKHLLKKLTLIYIPSVRLNFHKYKFATTGASNTQYTLANTLVAAYGISDELSLSIVGSYYRNTTYLGNYNDGFSFDQSLSYTLAKGFSASVGHAIGGSALAVNGKESNIQLFDADLSSYYVSLDFSY